MNEDEGLFLSLILDLKTFTKLDQSLHAMPATFQYAFKFLVLVVLVASYDEYPNKKVNILRLMIQCTTMMSEIVWLKYKWHYAAAAYKCHPKRAVTAVILSVPITITCHGRASKAPFRKLHWITERLTSN